MEKIVLKDEILEKIKSDQILFGKVAATLGLSVRTMSDLLPKNPPRFATASVLNVILEHVKDEKDNAFFTYEDLTKEIFEPVA